MPRAATGEAFDGVPALSGKVVVAGQSPEALPGVSQADVVPRLGGRWLAAKKSSLG
jgi:hypothetical protein